MSAPPPESALEAGLAIAGALEAAGIDHALGGALAFGLWAVPRGTLDVDVNVFVELDGLGEVVSALDGLGVEVDPARARDEAAREGMFVAWWGPVRVDVFVPSIAFAWEAARTRRRVEIEGRPTWFLSPEALAVFKLLFFRPKDLVDLERLVEVQGPDLDAGYVRRWIVEMLGEDDERVGRWDAIVGGA